MGELVVGDEYRAGRERITLLLAGADDATWSTPVPACPGWTVAGVVSHMLGTVEDALAGRLAGPPGEEMTAVQVARHAGDAGSDLLERWTELAPPFEEVLTAGGIFPAALDVLSHEQDVRQAIGRPGSRDLPVMAECAHRLVAGLEGPWVWQVRFPDGAVVTSTGDGPRHVLATTAFEVLRLRLGRRTEAEVRALAWEPGPPDDLSPLFVFGPRTESLHEG